MKTYLIIVYIMTGGYSPSITSQQIMFSNPGDCEVAAMHLESSNADDNRMIVKTSCVGVK